MEDQDSEPMDKEFSGTTQSEVGMAKKRQKIQDYQKATKLNEEQLTEKLNDECKQLQVLNEKLRRIVSARLPRIAQQIFQHSQTYEMNRDCEAARCNPPVEGEDCLGGKYSRTELKNTFTDTSNQEKADLDYSEVGYIQLFRYTFLMQNPNMRNRDQKRKRGKFWHHSQSQIFDGASGGYASLLLTLILFAELMYVTSYAAIF